MFDREGIGWNSRIERVLSKYVGVFYVPLDDKFRGSFVRGLFDMQK